MSKYVCKYCFKELASKSSLNNHVSNAQYCINNRIDINKDEIKIFKCDDCNKNFTSKQSLILHIAKCVYKIKNVYEEKSSITNSQYEEKISYLQEELVKKDVVIHELQDKLENVAIKAVSRHTVSNKTQINNYIQSMKPVTDENFLNNVQHLTIDHIKKGPEGYAEYALEYPLKDRMLCSDYSRRKIKFKDNDGNIITDPEMTTLAKKFFNSIREKNKELICKSANELKERLGDDNVMDTVVKLFDYKSDIEKGSEGEKTEFHHDFVKQVCSKTIKE
jgi:hypothetical protein